MHNTERSSGPSSREDGPVLYRFGRLAKERNLSHPRELRVGDEVAYRFSTTPTSALELDLLVEEEVLRSAHQQEVDGPANTVHETEISVE